ncbi:MAG: hypothetical protein HPY44_09240 [Armatimonadetes bacterium]|nr:hypothetical protein [Armatimonadota bacterium]
MPSSWSVIAILLASASAFCQDVPAPEADRIWVGPMPFITGREIRRDYFSTLTNPAAWPTVLARTDVFKSYIMVPPRDPLPGEDQPQSSDEELRGLAAFMRQRGIKIAFEVGGLRITDRLFGPLAGEKYAQTELTHLRRWIDCGGSVDYLTTDHAIMMNMRGAGFTGPGVSPERPGNMSMSELIRELVIYFETMRQAIPGVKFGVIESLGFFHIIGPDGREYPRTDPLLPVWKFDAFMDELLAAMKDKDLTLDHFHIDFGYEGVRFDGRNRGELDFGRILGVEQAVHARGIKAGVIINAFHDRSVQEPDPATASREAYENTLAFTRGYLAAGGKSEHIILQTWQPYPDVTGPEDRPHTVLNIARDVLGLIPNAE